MQEADYMIVGAGPAAFAALCGLSKEKTASVIQMSGALLSKLGSGSWLDGGFGSPSIAAELGLPQVRAFGAGGTTKLWHGGLFVPNRHDEMLCPEEGIENAKDLLPHLDRVLTAASGHSNQLFKALSHVVKVSESNRDVPESPLRQIYVPRSRYELTADDFYAVGKHFKRYQLASYAVVDIREINGRLEVLCAGEGGFKVFHVGRLILAAGVLGSGILLRKLLKLPSLAFSDHYHVFAGVVPSKRVANLSNEAVKSDGGKYHTSMKFSVKISDSKMADVLFSFRRVSNPDFPRSGRRFGKFIGVNALSRTDKFLLLAKNPMTGLEMVAYLWGIELPLEHSLVHATVSLRSHEGRILPDGVALNTPRADIVRAIEQAWSGMCSTLGMDSAVHAPFDQAQISDSVISGAQFVGTGSNLKDDEHGILDKIIIADCSRFSFTSVYNQGIVSLAAGYAAVARKL